MRRAGRISGGAVRRGESAPGGPDAADRGDRLRAIVAGPGMGQTAKAHQRRVFRDAYAGHPADRRQDREHHLLRRKFLFPAGELSRLFLSFSIDIFMSFMPIESHNM